jgi:hypothetical protein
MFRGLPVFNHLRLKNDWQAERILSMRIPGRPTGHRETKPLRRRPEMKSIANRLFVVAAVALSLGTFAYGQTTLRADVPFAFAVPGGPAQAGQYTVQINDFAGGKIVQISNRETGRSVVTLPHRLADPVNGVIAPRLVFRLCAGM